MSNGSSPRRARTISHERQLKRAYERSDLYDEKTKEIPAEKKQKEKERAPLPFLFLEDLQARPVEPLSWIAEDFILEGVVNGLFGDGGVGKDLVLLQLVIAMTCGGLWLGREVKQGRTICMPVEDDERELRRREDKITTYYKSLSRYHPRPKELMIVPLAGKEAILAVNKSGMVAPTSNYLDLRQKVETFKPTLVVVGNRVNIFSVNQMDDTSAQQCVRLLTSIALDYNTTIIMPGHVSLHGQKQGAPGEGSSGTVQWSNACRLRSYLHRIKNEDGSEDDVNARELQVMKTNYSETDKRIGLEWSEGVFKPDSLQIEPQPDEDAMEADENEVLSLFDRIRPGDRVSPLTTAPNNIVSAFLKRSNYFKRRGKPRLDDAITRLYGKGVLDTEFYGPPSNQHSQVVRKRAKKP